MLSNPWIGHSIHFAFYKLWKEVSSFSLCCTFVLSNPWIGHLSISNPWIVHSVFWPEDEGFGRDGMTASEEMEVMKSLLFNPAAGT